MFRIRAFKASQIQTDKRWCTLILSGDETIVHRRPSIRDVPNPFFLYMAAPGHLKSSSGFREQVFGLKF